jgi:hypothetical protein
VSDREQQVAEGAASAFHVLWRTAKVVAQEFVSREEFFESNTGVAGLQAGIDVAAVALDTTAAFLEQPLTLRTVPGRAPFVEEARQKLLLGWHVVEDRGTGPEDPRGTTGVSESQLIEENWPGHNRASYHECS